MNEEGLRVLESRAKLATIGLWLFVALSIPTGVSELLEAAGTVNIDTDVGALVMAVGLTYLAYFAAMVLSLVMVSRWIYRAHANLRDMGIEGLEFTPGWAVGCYFVPFVNLIKPFQAMRELWTTCHGEDDRFGGEAPYEVKVWWGAWIVGNILSSVSLRIAALGQGDSGSTAFSNVLDLGSTALLIAAALLLMKLIKDITAAQRSGTHVAAVFA
jgi:hypothetical protein